MTLHPTSNRRMFYRGLQRIEVESTYIFMCFDTWIHNHCPFFNEGLQMAINVWNKIKYVRGNRYFWFCFVKGLRKWTFLRLQSDTYDRTFVPLWTYFMITAPSVCGVTVLSNICRSLGAVFFSFVKTGVGEVFNGGNHIPLAAVARTHNSTSSLSFFPSFFLFLCFFIFCFFIFCFFVSSFLSIFLSFFPSPVNRTIITLSRLQPSWLRQAGRSLVRDSIR